MAQKSISIKTIWPDALQLAHAAAHMIVVESNKAVQEKGIFTLALSGGSTPKMLFQLLAQAPYKNNIPWKNVVVAFGDERFVAPTHEDSNYKMAMDNLLSHVPIPKKNILGIPVVKLTPESSAKLYETQLRKYVSAKNPFDVVLLGMGEDGHTASIFPKSELITEAKRWVANVWVAEKNMHRISFTFPLINRAKNIAFLVTGAAKAPIVKKILSGKGAAYPASKVTTAGTLYWFLDEAANGQS